MMETTKHTLTVPIKSQPSSKENIGSFILTDSAALSALRDHITKGKRIEFHVDMNEETGDINSVYFLAFNKKTEISNEQKEELKYLSHKLNHTLKLL